MLRKDIPPYIGPACYGANAAVRAAESIIEASDFTGKGTGGRYISVRFSPEEMCYYATMAVARRIMEFRPLTSDQPLTFYGPSFYLRVPESCVVPGIDTSLERPARWKRADQENVEWMGFGG